MSLASFYIINPLPPSYVTTLVYQILITRPAKMMRLSHTLSVLALMLAGARGKKVRTGIAASGAVIEEEMRFKGKSVAIEGEMRRLAEAGDRPALKTLFSTWRRDIDVNARQDASQGDTDGYTCGDKHLSLTSW